MTSPDKDFDLPDLQHLPRTSRVLVGRRPVYAGKPPANHLAGVA